MSPNNYSYQPQFPPMPSRVEDVVAWCRGMQMALEHWFKLTNSDIGLSGSQYNSFATIQASDGTTAVATAPEDTLIVSGIGVGATIETLASGNTVQYKVKDGSISVTQIDTTYGLVKATLISGGELLLTGGSNSTWNADVTVPDRLRDAYGGTGLGLTDTYVGFFNGGAATTYIEKNGDFRFYKDSNNVISWLDGTFTVKTETIYVAATNFRLDSASQIMTIGTYSDSTDYASLKIDHSRPALVLGDYVSAGSFNTCRLSTDGIRFSHTYTAYSYPSAVTAYCGLYPSFVSSTNYSGRVYSSSYLDGTYDERAQFNGGALQVGRKTRVSSEIADYIVNIGYAAGGTIGRSSTKDITINSSGECSVPAGCLSGIIPAARFNGTATVGNILKVGADGTPTWSAP